MESTIVKGMSVLEILARSQVPVRLSVIAERLGLPKSGVHRLLGTLSELGFVEQDEESSRYSATLKLWEWGQAIIAEHPAKRAAAPYMQELHKMTSETVNLVVRDKFEVLYIDKILSPRPLRFSTQPGSRTPLLLSATGKSMLSLEPEDSARAFIKDSMAENPALAHLDPDEIIAELASIRRAGYAFSDGTGTSGIVSFGAPIMGRNGRSNAALSVTAPRERLDENKESDIVEALLHICARIAETVGRL